ncbi:MAG: hypothetical protein ACK4MQ_09840 [Hyphomonas sp.]
MGQDRKRPDYREDDMSRFAGWDALADDVFGLNVRGFRTMWVSVFNPARIFEAARDADWHGRYTPAIRLSFMIIAFTMFLQFIWMSEGSALWQAMREVAETFPDDWQGRDAETATRDVLLAFSVAFPIAYFGVHIPLSLIAGTWGPQTPLPVRSRLYFSTLVPAVIIGLVMTLVQARLPNEQLGAISPFLSVVSFGVYFLIIFRGLAPRVPASGRIWRAGLTSAIIMVADFLVAAITVLSAQAYVMGTPPGG